MCSSRCDLNGRAAPAVLLHLRHPLTGHLIGVVGGTHCDLVLDDTLTFQLLVALTAKQKHRPIEPRGFLQAVLSTLQRHSPISYLRAAYQRGLHTA